MSETTSEHSPSLREALQASYTQHTQPDEPSGRSNTTAPAAPRDKPSDAGSQGAAVEGEGGAQSPPGGAPSEPPSGGPQRDAQGRFQAKAGDAPSGTAAGSSAAPEPPEGYDPAVWAMLSPEAREKTVAWAKTTSSKYEPYQGLDRVLTQQRRDALAMQYGGVDKAFEQLFALSDFAARDPANFVRQFSAQRGVDLNRLVAPPQQGQQQPQLTPEQAFRHIARQEAEQAQQRREVDRQYEDFARDAAAEHRENPKVREVMAVLLATNQANDYRQAYDMAVRAHPELGPKWAQAQAETTAKAQQEQAAEAALANTRLAEAKASAAASVVGAPGTARPNADAATRNQSVRAALEGAFERAGGARV